jgi:hypothetical protein
MEVFRYVAQERLCRSRRWNVAGEELLEGDHAAIQFAGAVVVLLHHRTVQRDAGKGAARARVGKDLGAHLPVGAALGVTAYRASGCGSVSAHFEFAGKQLRHAVLVHHEHHQIDGLAANLQTPASTLDDERRGRAPFAIVAAGCDAASITRAYDKAAILHRGHNGNAIGRPENLFRNTFIWRGHDFLQYIAGCYDAILYFIAGLISCGGARNRK